MLFMSPIASKPSRHGACPRVIMDPEGSTHVAVESPLEMIREPMDTRRHDLCKRLHKHFYKAAVTMAAVRQMLRGENIQSLLVHLFSHRIHCHSARS